MLRIIVILIIILFSLSITAANKLKQNFFGVQGFLLTTLIEQANLTDQDLPNSLNESQVTEYQEKALHDVKNTLATYGYFNSVVTASHQIRQGLWHIDYQIKPGNRFVITNVDFKISGAATSDNQFQQIIHHFLLKQGDVMLMKRYHEAKASLVDLAAQRGYFAARLEKTQVLIDTAKSSATVIIHFDSGPRYYFGPVTFLPSPYSTRFLQRFVPFHTGQFFSNKKIVKLQENLSICNFFQQVAVTPKPDQAQNLMVPIEIELTSRKAIQYNLGAGFGTDTGFRGLAGLQLRRLNSNGHYADTLIQASQKLNHFEASYSIPGHNPVTDLYKLSAAAEQQHLNTSGKSRSEKIEASHIMTYWSWQQTLSLSLRDEHSEPTDGRPIINSTMLLPNFNWSRVKSDDPIRPNKGYQLNLNIRGASRALLSNTDFIQGAIQGKALIPLTEDTRLITKGQLGYTLITDINQLPISLQFYTGGSQTVRGYQFQELGPGKTLLIGSFELQQRIKGDFYLAAFIDAGNVSNSLTANLKKSIGLGIVWRSPVGAIEMTIAQALDKPGQPKLLQFSMGPEL